MNYTMDWIVNLTLDSIMDWTVELTIVLALPFKNALTPPPQLQTQLHISDAL